MNIGYYRYCLSIGSNLGDKAQIIANTLKFLDLHPHKLLKLSSMYSSKAWGYESTNKFVNCCVYIESILPPFELLNHLKMFEKSLGRQKANSGNYEDRTIDIDIILCGQDIVNSEKLIIPHPLFHKRKFVLVPLDEICPDFRHPLLDKSVHELLMVCEDESLLEKI